MKYEWRRRALEWGVAEIFKRRGQRGYSSKGTRREVRFQRTPTAFQISIDHRRTRFHSSIAALWGQQKDYLERHDGSLWDALIINMVRVDL